MHFSTGIHATNDGINPIKLISKLTSHQLVSVELIPLSFNAMKLRTIGRVRRISTALALPIEPIAAGPSDCDELLPPSLMSSPVDS